METKRERNGNGFRKGRGLLEVDMKMDQQKHGDEKRKKWKRI